LYFKLPNKHIFILQEKDVVARSSPDLHYNKATVSTDKPLTVQEWSNICFNVNSKEIQIILSLF